MIIVGLTQANAIEIRLVSLGVVLISNRNALSARLLHKVRHRNLRFPHIPATANLAEMSMDQV